MRFPFTSKKDTPESSLSTSLEDYLETIYELSGSGATVRVKDIADARSVKAASVSVALNKLAELGHVNYEPRGRISLTESGLKIGRKMLSRHKLLCRFFADVLQLPKNEAEVQACAMEHSLTDSGMNQLVRFFEFLGSCPDVGNVIERFHSCPRRHDESPDIIGDESASGVNHCAACHPEMHLETKTLPLTAIPAGSSARVTNVISDGAARQRMLDMGLLPQTRVVVERLGPGGETIWIKCMGTQLGLRKIEAESVLVVAEDQA